MSNPVGRPPKYNTPEEMQVAIDAYFTECANKESPQPLTVTGLALALDMTRRGLLDYCEKSDEFAHTVKRAKLVVENFIEKRLYEPNATGSIFNLKNNFQWVDKTEQDQNINGTLEVKQITRTVIDPVNGTTNSNA